MGKKVRKSAVPKARVLDKSAGSNGAEKKKAVASTPKKAKGKFIKIGKGGDSDSDDDIAAAEMFDDEPAPLEGRYKGLPAMDDDEDDEDADSFLDKEPAAPAKKQRGRLAAAAAGGDDDDESEPFDDDFGVIEGHDSDESDMDSDVADDFEAKVAKEKHRLKMQHQDHANEMALQAMTRRGTVFGKQQAKAVEGVEEDIAEEEDEEEEEDGVVENITPEQRKDRIEECLRVLDSITDTREGEHTREEYLDVLAGDLIEIYDYSPWLMKKLMELFPPRELFEFLEVNEKQRPLTIRVNTLKTTRRDLAQALTRKGMSVEPTGPWCKVGLQIFESDVAVGSTPEYLGGHYLVQSASSFLPVLALDVVEGQRVLDMAAAPGGKTTHIAQLLKNTGALVANDVSAERLIGLRGNVLRMGITNCIVTNYNGVGFERIMKNFDRVLLDAPCTGLGVISRDPRIKQTKQDRDMQVCTSLQKKLILSAIDSLKVGGILCYSTCSILIEENEAVIDYALTHRHIRIIDTGMPFGRPGVTKFRSKRFHASVENSRRYYPHVFNMDGFFVAKIEKLKNGDKDDVTMADEEPTKKRRGKKDDKKRKEPEGGAWAPPAKVQKRLDNAKAVAEKPAAPAKQAVKLSVVPKAAKPAADAADKDGADKRSRWGRKKQKDGEKKREARKEGAAATETVKAKAKAKAAPAKKASEPKAKASAKKAKVSKK